MEHYAEHSSKSPTSTQCTVYYCSYYLELEFFISHFTFVIFFKAKNQLTAILLKLCIDAMKHKENRAKNNEHKIVNKQKKT